MQKKIIATIATIIIALALAGAFIAGYQTRTEITINSATSLGLGVGANGAGPGKIQFPDATIHSTIYVYQYGKLVATYHHPGVVTKLGMNLTLCKLTNNAAYNTTQYSYNIAYVSIGNQGTLTSDSTVLPGEWNRTTGTIHDATYNMFNITAVFHPDTGPYTADCLGLNFITGIGVNYSLWGYDTFTEVTGIDNTFTVTVEVKVALS
jgi:hypothetical protein